MGGAIIMLKTTLIRFLLVLILIGTLITGCGSNDAVEPSETTDPTVATVAEETTQSPQASESASSDANTDSAIVSLGVENSDLGNIMNGQYYFATDTQIFYSSFDENNKAHIYAVNKDGSGFKPIFDGFGWSLVVIDDQLYFSGNAGEQIDGTYNVYRMNLDGSKVEKIIDKYSYGMFFYDQYLYYMRSNDTESTLMSICRASLDGTNEEVLFPNGYSPIIYQNQLYYIDNQGNMYRTEPDGSNPEVLLTAAVKSYAIGSDRIFYNDFNHNIYSCKLDGSENTLVRLSSGIPIYSVNAYKDQIYFSEYDTNFNYAKYGYNYTIISCKFDGSEEKALFSSTSYGIYTNLVDNQLMTLDYVLADTSGQMTAWIMTMNLDGSNPQALSR